MKTLLCLFVLLLTSITATMTAFGQAERKARTLDDYQRRTLWELSNSQPPYIADQVHINDPNLSVIVHADLLPSRVRAIYDGTTRPLHERRQLLIRQWANRRDGTPEFDIAPYDTEMLVIENGESYWLAVRKESLRQLDQELKKGEAVELLLIKMGNVRIDKKLEPVLLVENYLKQ